MMSPNRISLARLPTPIQKLKTISQDLGKDVFIWRDDLNGFTESGNKLRKLEYLMADAIAQGCDWVITCGGPQSNHTRATAIVARQLGLDVSILVLAKPGFDHGKTPNGNLLLNQIFDSKMTWLDFDEFQKMGANYDYFLAEEADKLKAAGHKPYIIPLGGSNPIGTFGYRNAVKEMLTTWTAINCNSNNTTNISSGNTKPDGDISISVGNTNGSAPDSLFCALGSGGTFVGLQLGIQEQKIKTQLFGINVIGPIETAEKYVTTLHDSVAKQLGIKINTDQSHQIDGYLGAGYSIASDADLEFYVQLARDEGVLLDPCYTGKAFQGMISEIKKSPERFGKEILFLHSGGIFADFSYAEQFKKVLNAQST